MPVVIDGTAGITTNAVNTASGSLVLGTGGGTAVTIDVSQNSTNAGWVKFPVFTVAGLPAAGTAGRRAFVSNALTPVALSAVVGGGAVTVPVYDNGSTWIVG